MLQDENVMAANRYGALDLLPDMICVVGRDGSCGYFNRAWREYGAAAFTSPQWMDWILPSERDEADRAVRDAALSGRAGETDLRLLHPVEGVRWFLLRVRPLPGEDAAGYLYSLTDIQARKRRELEMQRDIRAQADMLNVSVDCIKMVRPDGTLSRMNRAGCQALNVAEASGFGMDWISLLPKDAHLAGRQALLRAKQGENARFLGVSQLPGQDPRYWDNMLTPLKNASDTVEAILCVSRDVTAERASDRRIASLLHELTHRSKNMLAVVQALIRRTVPDPHAPYVSVLGQRIAAIARNQDLLINGRWAGITVEALLASQTAVIGDVEQKRVLLQGPGGLRLLPETAERIGLAIYELTTNAIKYGALSNESGIVTISWAVQQHGDGDPFRLMWREAGGPAVRAPRTHGFGTAVIERNPRAVMGAAVTYRYEPAGVTWTFDAPVSSVLEDRVQAAGAGGVSLSQPLPGPA